MAALPASAAMSVDVPCVGERAKFLPYQFEMLLDKQTLDALQGGPVAWLTDSPDASTRDWHAQGFEHSLFPGGVIPFKFILKGPDGKGMHNLAAMYYAMAHRARMVSGPPVAIATVEFQHEAFFECIAAGSLMVSSKQHTLNFCKNITPENYSGTECPLVQELTDGDTILGAGYRFLDQGQQRDASD